MTKGAKPEISIIIPCFDAEKTIINTLDSKTPCHISFFILFFPLWQFSNIPVPFC